MNDHPRIAIFLATSGQSGVDRAARNLIPALARRGYQVDLLKVRGHGPDLDELPPGVRVVDLGHDHVYPCALAVARYLRRERPRVLLSDKDRVNRTALLARWLSGTRIPVVCYVGTPVSLEHAHRSAARQRRHRNWMRRLYPAADGFLADSPGVKEDLLAYTGLPRERVIVVPRPVVPAALFEDGVVPPPHPWLAPGMPPVVLGVGELSGGKDFATLLRAFAQLRARQACRLMILGKGKQYDALLAQAEALGVRDDVALLGFRRDVPAFMRHAAVLGLASLREGLSFVLIEALACGTPVVSTDCPHGPRAVLQDGRYGALVPVGDADAMAAALAESLGSRRSPEALRAAARPYEIETATDAALLALGLPLRIGATAAIGPAPQPQPEALAAG